MTGGAGPPRSARQGRWGAGGLRRAPPFPSIRITLPIPGWFPFPVRRTLRLDPFEGGWRPTAVVALALILLGLWLLRPTGPGPPPVPVPASTADGYLFCTWNVENLFDDRDDPADRDADETWFGAHPEAVTEKVGLLARALLLQNEGRGPDVLTVVEVENRRAVELLRDALNSVLPPDVPRYTGLVHRDNRSGRRIEPAVLTRLPVRDDRTRSFAPLRILEAHLEGPGGAPLVVLASHWTSRIREGSEARRAAYADTLYQRARELTDSDPAADVLIAGDFNDEPGDPSVGEHLHALADPDRVRDASRAGAPLRLLDLTARLDPARDGTYYYKGRWEVLDHLVASPGLLDPSGWQVMPETVRVENSGSLRFGRDGRPWRFGNPGNTNPRGPSDHFAVTVRLAVRPIDSATSEPATAPPDSEPPVDP